MLELQPDPYKPPDPTLSFYAEGKESSENNAEPEATDSNLGALFSYL